VDAGSTAVPFVETHTFAVVQTSWYIVFESRNIQICLIPFSREKNIIQRDKLIVDTPIIRTARQIGKLNSSLAAARINNILMETGWTLSFWRTVVQFGSLAYSVVSTSAVNLTTLLYCFPDYYPRRR
jgi:hypothetical protein